MQFFDITTIASLKKEQTKYLHAQCSPKGNAVLFHLPYIFMSNGIVQCRILLFFPVSICIYKMSNMYMHGVSCSCFDETECNYFSFDFFLKKFPV